MSAKGQKALYEQIVNQLNEARGRRNAAKNKASKANEALKKAQAEVGAIESLLTSAGIDIPAEVVVEKTKGKGKGKSKSKKGGSKKGGLARAILTALAGSDEEWMTTGQIVTELDGAYAETSIYSTISKMAKAGQIKTGPKVGRGNSYALPDGPIDTSDPDDGDDDASGDNEPDNENGVTDDDATDNADATEPEPAGAASE